MNSSFSSNTVAKWVKPVLTAVLGLMLVFRPGSLTSTIARVIGFVIALAGSGLMVSFVFSNNQKQDYLKFCGGIILLVLGFSIIARPVSLERQIGRVIGIVLLLQGIRGLTKPFANHEKVTATLSCVAGTILILIPVTASRLVVMICGVVVLLIGVGMLIDTASSKSSGSDDNIIDAR